MSRLHFEVSLSVNLTGLEFFQYMYFQVQALSNRMLNVFVLSFISQLSHTINKKSVTTKDKELESLFERHNAGLDFISALDYNVTTEGSITPPSGNSHQLHGASCALYGLFWELSYDTHSKHWCTLL